MRPSPLCYGWRFSANLTAHRLLQWTATGALNSFGVVGRLADGVGQVEMLVEHPEVQRIRPPVPPPKVVCLGVACTTGNVRALRAASPSMFPSHLGWTARSRGG